jgi:hypothetical protein
MTAILKTKGGEIVAAPPVPEFRDPPEIMRWGQRYFVYQATEAGRYLYREAICYPIATTLEMRPALVQEGG